MIRMLKKGAIFDWRVYDDFGFLFFPPTRVLYIQGYSMLSL